MAVPSDALPSEAVGTAVGVLLYSFICLLASTVLLGMLWRHGDRSSYILAVAATVSISTLASVIQQIHYCVVWRVIAIAKFEDANIADHSPAVKIAGASHPVQAVLFWIQFYCYNVDSFLIMFWASALFSGTWDISINWPAGLEERIALYCKVFAIFVPAIPLGIVHIPAVYKHDTAFIVIADILLMTSLAAGSIILVLTLFKYLRKRAELSSLRSSELSSTGTRSLNQNLTSATRQERRRRRDEQWLIIRFTIAFVVLGCFQLSNIIFHILATRATRTLSAASSPNFSPAQARQDLLLFMPGVTASLIAWLIFGTTAAFRGDYILCFGRCVRVFKRKAGDAESIGSGGRSDVELVPRAATSGKNDVGYSVECRGGGGKRLL